MLRCNRDGPLCFKISDTANQCRLRKGGRPKLWWKGDKEALNYDNLDEIKIELSLSYTFFWMTMTGKQCRLRTRGRPMLWCKGDGAPSGRVQSQSELCVPTFVFLFRFSFIFPGCKLQAFRKTSPNSNNLNICKSTDGIRRLWQKSINLSMPSLTLRWKTKHFGDLLLDISQQISTHLSMITSPRHP